MLSMILTIISILIKIYKIIALTFDPAVIITAIISTTSMMGIYWLLSEAVPRFLALNYGTGEPLISTGFEYNGSAPQTKEFPSNKSGELPNVKYATNNGTNGAGQSASVPAQGVPANRNYNRLFNIAFNSADNTRERIGRLEAFRAANPFSVRWETEILVEVDHVYTMMKIMDNAQTNEPFFQGPNIGDSLANQF